MAKARKNILYKTFDLKSYGFPEIPVFGHYRTDTAYPSLEKHTHEAYEICCLVEGRQNDSVRGKDYLLKGGDIFITKPGEIHSSGKMAQERGSLFWIHIFPEKAKYAMFGLAREKGMILINSLSNIKPRMFPGTPNVLKALSTAYCEIENKANPLHKIAISNSLVTILLEIIKCGNSVKEEPENDMNQAVEYIETRLELPMRVPEIAKAIGLTETWFKVKFKQATGLPPAEYILRKRIYKAREFLEQGKGNVSDAAMKFGFSSSQHFATAFKKYNKLAPSKYVPR